MLLEISLLALIISDWLGYFIREATCINVGRLPVFSDGRFISVTIKLGYSANCEFNALSQ